MSFFSLEFSLSGRDSRGGHRKFVEDVISSIVRLTV